MKAYYVLIGLFALFCSCSGQETKEKNIVAYDTAFDSKKTTSQKEVVNINLDSIKKKIIVSKTSSSDTIKYQFSLEDVGTEGNEGIAYYLNGSVRKAEIEIYTSMWRYHIQYYFSEKKIKVIENTYNISNASSNKTESIKQTDYTIDYTGKLIGNADKERLDIFKEFKRVVPFELK